MEKPFSQSCENNKEPILNVLKAAFKDASFVLEIGSGTGQHAVHFARNLPRLVWQPTDLAENIPDMKLWFDEAKLPNIKEPVELNVSDAMWPVGEADAVFTANTLHIMAKSKIECMFDGMEPVPGTVGHSAFTAPLTTAANIRARATGNSTPGSMSRTQRALYATSSGLIPLPRGQGSSSSKTTKCPPITTSSNGGSPPNYPRILHFSQPSNNPFVLHAGRSLGEAWSLSKDAVLFPSLPQDVSGTFILFQTRTIFYQHIHVCPHRLTWSKTSSPSSSEIIF